MAGAEHIDRLRKLLSDDELEQYQRFHYEDDRHNYLVSHALVRTVLSKYADIPPHAWRFLRNEHGKPEISIEAATQVLRFNLSHTEGICGCVVTLGDDCGIDVEMEKRKNNLAGIARKMFSSKEMASLANLDETDFRKAFFTLWTLRESYVKALGTGLAGSSEAFHFSIGDETIEIEESAASTKQAEGHWQFFLHEPTAEHICAVSVRTRLSLIHI